MQSVHNFFKVECTLLFCIFSLICIYKHKKHYWKRHSVWKSSFSVTIVNALNKKEGFIQIVIRKIARHSKCTTLHTDGSSYWRTCRYTLVKNFLTINSCCARPSFTVYFLPDKYTCMCFVWTPMLFIFIVDAYIYLLKYFASEKWVKSGGAGRGYFSYISICHSDQFNRI